MDKEIITFRLDGEMFGFPMEEVRELIRPMGTTKVPKAPPFVEGIVNLRGRVIPIVNLRRRLGLQDQEGGEGGVLLVELDGRIVGLLVDQVEGISRVSQESIGFPDTLKEGRVDVSYVTGVGQSEQGAVVLLNPAKILEAE